MERVSSYFSPMLSRDVLEEKTHYRRRLLLDLEKCFDAVSISIAERGIGGSRSVQPEQDEIVYVMAGRSSMGAGAEVRVGHGVGRRRVASQFAAVKRWDVDYLENYRQGLWRDFRHLRSALDLPPVPTNTHRQEQAPPQAPQSNEHAATTTEHFRVRGWRRFFAVPAVVRLVHSLR